MSDAQVPPQRIDAEESVLGAMLMSPNAITAVSDVLRPDDFYRGSHGEIYRAALELDAKGEPVDAVTMIAELKRQGALDKVGGDTRVRKLAALVPVTGNAKHYAKIVKETAQLRRLIRAGGEISNLGWDGQGDANELVEKAERLLAEAADATFEGETELISSEYRPLYERIANAVETGVPISGLASGFPDLDRLTTGFYPGTLIVLGARPKVGKSLLALNIAEHLVENEVPVIFFSLEMSKPELVQRMIVRHTRVEMNKLRTGTIDQHELAKVKAWLAKSKDRPLAVEDTGIVSLAAMRARARRHQKKHGLGFIVVDYLQLMLTEGGRNENRTNEVAQLTRGLKLLAKELDVPVLLLSQLNRGVEARENKRPMLSDLRDSGAIEQDADMVMFLYREELYKMVEADKARDAELIVAANRMGETDTIKLLFQGRRQQFASPARAVESEAA